MNKQRLEIPDLLKGVAVMLMVQVHLTELFATPDFYASLAGKISLFLGGPPAAPAFMAVMGFFLARKAQPLLQQIKRGLLLLLLGFALNIGLNLHLLIKIVSGSYQLDPLRYIFGVDILFLAGISIVVVALLRPLLQKRWVLWLLLIPVSALANRWLPVYGGEAQWLRYLQAYFWGHYSWSFFPFFPWFSYVLTGYVFYLIYERFARFITIKFRRISGLVLLILIVSTFAYGFRVATLLEVYYHHSALFVAWTAAFILLWTLALALLNKLAGKTTLIKYLRWAGKNVTAFYVVQWLIIGNIATAIYRTQAGWTLPLWFIGVVGVSSLLILVYRAQGSKSKAQGTRQ
ncbi:MAG TPA: acyltransferase family protein [Bacteroidales bacterium]|nr:acyltransferase family protein [Bacteroidales bacterium]